MHTCLGWVVDADEQGVGSECRTVAAALCHIVIPVSLECLRGIACFDMGGSKLRLSHVQYSASLG